MMFALKFIPLVVKQVVRHRTRTLLTVGGVAMAMFLFCAVQAMQAGVKEATETTAKDTTLVVYRQNRFCPATSRLPQYYGDRIAKIPGVVSVVPMKIVVTNCRTSLDVITFRGVPEDQFVEKYAPTFNVIDGSATGWQSRTDAALVGETLANRRGWKVGDQFDAVGITAYVAGIIRSDQPQDQNVAYVHLDFIQRASGDRKLGVVTQFNVKVADPAQLESVAAAIDAEFARDSEPTQTSAEKAFVARAAADVVSLVGFTKWLGWGSLAAVLALVANAIVLSVQDRIREHAVLQTLGFNGRLIAMLIVAEGLLLGLMGGLLGVAVALAVLRWGQFSISSEGLSIQMSAGLSVIVTGLIVSATLGVLAGLVPAVQASRREITSCFRAA
ncbi:MAG TPA: ABC transporter permease [Tepidisphaeraceae bacterium]|nr:ABC transporter permease [Tepidisphaeraceae bacterium]